jgi:hypothetical protein
MGFISTTGVIIGEYLLFLHKYSAVNLQLVATCCEKKLFCDARHNISFPVWQYTPTFCIKGSVSYGAVCSEQAEFLV